MTKLIYVDEQPIEGRKIIRSAVNSGYFTQDQVKTIEPLADIKETIAEILSHHCDVLITDYKLADHNDSIDYTGADLVNAMLDRREDFPCFITTSYAEEASSDDVDILGLFSKSEIDDEQGAHNGELTFFRRVRSKLDRHKENILQLSLRHDMLAHKLEEEGLDSAEAQELFDLDNCIERSYIGDQANALHLNERALKPIGELLEKARNLAAQIEAEISENSNENDS